MLEYSGKKISTHNEAIYKGTFTHNGMLLNISTNSFTVGYAQCLAPDGQSGKSVKFGDGVFYDASGKNNVVFAGAPTVTGAVPAFAGIMSREPGYASSSPVTNDEVAPQQDGTLIKQGYVIYKHGDVNYGSGVAYEDVPLFGKVYVNYEVFVRKSDGTVYFAPRSTDFETSGDFRIGKVILTNPDDRSVTVYISPAFLADTATISGGTPTLTLGSPTANSIPVSVQVDLPASIVIEYKVTSGGSYERMEEAVEAEWNADEGHYIATTTIEGLTASTGYTVKATAITAAGGAAGTEKTASTTA